MGAALGLLLAIQAEREGALGQLAGWCVGCLAVLFAVAFLESKLRKGK